MQSLTNMDNTSALSTKVYEALLNILKKTQILALQEVSGFEARYKGRSSALNRLKHTITEYTPWYRDGGELHLSMMQIESDLPHSNSLCVVYWKL